jgi:hypothetical protein
MTQNDDLRTAQAKLGANVAATNADGTDTLPTPTVVIVDAAGTIRWIDVHPNFHLVAGEGIRPELDARRSTSSAAARTPAAK